MRRGQAQFGETEIGSFSTCGKIAWRIALKWAKSQKQSHKWQTASCESFGAGPRCSSVTDFEGICSLVAPRPAPKSFATCHPRFMR